MEGGRDAGIRKRASTTYAGLTKEVGVLAALRGCICMFLKLNVCRLWIVMSR